MLPLAGAPRLAILGREVRCGTGFADLVAVELETGRPVVIEIKLASNADRRQVLTQVLGYAAYIRRLDTPSFDAVLAQHLAKVGVGSVTTAAAAASQDPSFDVTSFASRLNEALEDGRLRCVVVLDAAGPDLVELVGYLQEVSNERLSLDLITVTAYDIGGRKVLVPQLVEPDRSQVTAAAAGGSAPQPKSPIVRGSEVFATSIETAPPDRRPDLRRLLDWALSLEVDGLAVLYTSTGKGRWVLNPRLPGQERGMVMIWNENGAFLSPYRTVLQQEAPAALDELDQKVPGQIGQGNYIKVEYDEELLSLLRTAYEEAAQTAL
ncbi:MAG: hypothetical protein M3Z02_06430 [Actinomycetota bacterium]|nr:hypothetical protein [Actinomycetota bacterium]